MADTDQSARIAALLDKHKGSVSANIDAIVNGNGGIKELTATMKGLDIAQQAKIADLRAELATVKADCARLEQQLSALTSTVQILMSSQKRPNLIDFGDQGHV